MQILHPLVLIIGIIVTIIILTIIIFAGHKSKYVSGVRVANTHFTQGLDIYKKINKLKNIILGIVIAAIFISTICTIILIARPYKVSDVTTEEKKRDIFLCMDVSYSLCSLNGSLVSDLQDIVAGLDGDRVGISMYNTSTILYIPMTDDYEFVIKKLEEIKPYFELQSEYMQMVYGPIEEIDYERINTLQEELAIYDAGTLVRNNVKGSSLIGEGLASCMYSFPRLGESDRTRLIIMSTDNCQQQILPPEVELDEATDICKKNDITVFGIFPNEENYRQYNDEDYSGALIQYQQNVEKTGGEFYMESDNLSVKDILNDINSKEALLTDEVITTREIDMPQVPVIILIISLIILFTVGAVLIL